MKYSQEWGSEGTGLARNEVAECENTESCTRFKASWEEERSYDSYPSREAAEECVLLREELAKDLAQDVFSDIIYIRKDASFLIWREDDMATTEDWSDGLGVLPSLSSSIIE